MTAYKYVARDEESRVNWGDISKKWSDAIVTGEETREKKRADIQTATDELTDSIINAPMGENEGVNAWYSNFADQSSEYLLDANRRLKSGDLKVRDYNTIMANMTQGTERMTGLAKDYSDNYAIKMERLKNDDSQQAELAMMELAEGYANFTNTQGIVNPTNGMISIAKNDTGETITIPQMRAYINMQYDKYDVGAALDKQVARLASDKRVIMSGDVKTRESQLRAWNLAKDNLLDAELADGLHVSSILTEDVGGYNVVTDATKVGENDVLFVLDPSQPSAGYRVPLYGLDLSNMTEADLDMIFSADLDDTQRSALIKQAEEQRGVARDWLNTDFERRMAIVDEPMKEPTSGTTAGERGASAQGKVNLRALEKIHGGKDKEVQEGLEHVFGKDPSYRTSRVEGSGDNRKVVVEYYDKAEKRSYTREFNIPVGLKDWIDVGSAEFYNESQIPYVYDAYENQPRLYEGKRGEGTGATQRIVVVDDLASIEVTGDDNKKVSVGERIGSLVGEARIEYDPGVEASQNADVVRSVLNASPVGLDAEVTSIDEDVIQGTTDKGIRYSGIRIFVPGRMDLPLVVPNETASLAALLGILEVIASSTSVNTADLVDMLPEEAKMYNDAKVVGEPRSTSRGSGGAGAAAAIYTPGG